MAKLSRLLLGVATAVTLFTGAANAALISFTPTSAPGVVVSPPFGSLAPGGTLGTNYINFGVDFTSGGVEGYFNDPPFAFGGVNSGGIVDLLSPIDGRIVLLGTTTAAVTDYFYAEAGHAPEGSLTLSLFDSFGGLIASILNGPPLGANGRTTFSYSGAGIAFFSIFGTDTFGVDEIRLNTPVSSVPVPAALPLLAAGLGALGVASRRRRNRKSA